jgi:UDP-N-acetylmuramate dehydrogenase
MTKMIDFSRYSTIRVGPVMEVELIEDATWDKPDYFIIGAASNLLITGRTTKLAKLSKNFDYIRIEGERLVVGAATSSGKLLSFVHKHNIANLEFLSRLPGNIGGMVKMNAGLKEWEIFNSLLGIKTNRGEFAKSRIPHGYRYTNIEGVILEATFTMETGFSDARFKMFSAMRENQPGEPSAGSCFKNPKPHFAAKLIEEAGLKGHRIGGMAFSDKHANFLVNLGNGTATEALAIIELAKNEVLRRFNVQLEQEIIIL